MTKKLSYLFVLVFTIIVISSPFVIIQFLIKVKVECKSQFGGCPEEITQSLSSLNSKSLFEVKKKSGEYLKKSFLVSDYSTQYKLPNILEVNLVVKKPLFAIKDNETGKTFAVGKDGNILSEVSSTSLPTVIQNGQTPNLFTLNLMLGVYQMYQVLYGTIADNALVVDIPPGLRVIFPLRGEDPSVLLGSLRLIQSKITSDYQGVYSQVDMRYKNPVLR